MNSLLRFSPVVGRLARGFVPSHTQHTRQIAQVVTAYQGGGNRPYTPNRNRSDGDFRGGRGGPRGRREMEPAIPINAAIRVPEVRLLNEAKEALGVVPTSEALEMAQDAGVDLVMVVADASPPVCRLIEFSKYNYELAKAVKDAKKKQRESAIETKELKLRPATDVHDYQVRVRAAQKFLAKGDKVKLTLQFKGREMEFKDIGRQMFERFLEDMEGAASIEQPMQMQGRQMTMVIGPKKVEQQ